MSAMSAGGKALNPVALGTLATGLGIVVSWLGFRPVLDAAIPDRLVAFPVTGREISPTSTPPARSSAGSSRIGARPAPSRTAAPSTSPGTAPPAPPVVPDGWTAIGPGRYLRSFRLV